MPSKVQQNRRGRTVGPNIVRAWFDVVVNPLLWGLAAERKVLAAENWTWSFERGRLLSVVPVREHVVIEGWDMLEQLLRVRPEIRPVIEEHDKRVEKLLSACAAFHRALSSSQGLRAAFHKAQAELGSQPQDTLKLIFLATPPEHYLDVLAGYGVNSVGDLPDYYGTAAFWNARKNEFLQARQSDDVRPHWEGTRKAGAQMLRAVNSLTEVLKTARDELSLEHDVPFVQYISPTEPVRA